MRMPLLGIASLVVVAAGCSPNLAGAPCTTNNNCPTNQVCVAGACTAGGGSGVGGGAGGGTSAFYLLVVTLGGMGNGVVISSPSGINCGTSCSKMFADGVVVTLSTVSGPNSDFGGWLGAGCATAGTGDCMVTMTGPMGV